MISELLFNRAQQVIPGGVNSPVRAFGGVGGTPRFMARGAGPYLMDVEGQQYIDYVGSWGPLILGHAHPHVIAAVKQAAEQGLTFGAPSPLEVELAELVCQLLPSIEQVRFVSSGTEATMSAIRLARGFTGRSKIVKFEGCYHGHADFLLVKGGSGLLTFGTPSSAGVPAPFTESTLVAPFNDLESTKRLFVEQGQEIAAIIVEPVAANMNCVLPQPHFLQGLRELCNQYGAILIFDEVITGFRLGLQSAQGYYGVGPDLTTLGKIIGGGMPVGAFGGRRDIMQYLSPLGPVYQAGTLSGNPVAMAAGLATLKQLQVPEFYPQLNQKTEKLVTGLRQIASRLGIPLLIQSCESLLGLFFTDQKQVENLSQVSQCSQEQYKMFFHGMLKEGVYFAPSAFEVGFVSSAHADDDIEKTLTAAEKVLSGSVFPLHAGNLS